MKRKPSFVQIVRHLIQVLAFFLFPGLFLSLYTAIKNIYIALISGSFSLSGSGTDLALMLAVLPISIIWGRFFCGFLCSFGALSELIYALSGTLWKGRKPIPKRMDGILKYLKYLIFLLLFVFVWTLQFQIDNRLNPLYVFGVYSKSWTSASAAFTVGGFLLLCILIGSVFVERFFCRYLCPMGALFSALSRLRLFKILRRTNSCVSCGQCDRSCSMGIPVSGGARVTSGECIDCMRCTERCPQNALSSNASPVVAGTTAAVLMTGLYYAGTVGVSRMEVDRAEALTSEAAEQGSYTDGRYTGSAQGYRGTIEAEVQVENGFLTDIEILSYADDADFFERAKNSVIAEILSAQQPNVSAVSGATFSSRGIMQAVADALGIAEDDSAEAALPAEGSASDDRSEHADITEPAPESEDRGQSTDDTDMPSDSDAAALEEDAQQGDAAASDNRFTDGVYTGSGTGFRGTTTVEVTVRDGSIADITVLSYQDDDRFFSTARDPIIQAILSSQSTDVSAVSGATFSSNGLIEAVSNALGQTFDNPNSANQNHHGHGMGHQHEHGPI